MVSNEKEFSNVFRFVVKQGDVILGEKVFDADVFNPFTRYSINVREILPKATTKLQVTLSRKSYTTVMGVGNGESYDFHEHYLNMLDSYPKEYQQEMIYSPESIVQEIEGRTIRGVECKMGLYINDKTIVERTFYVNGFNPIARYSTELTEAIVDIADIIFEQIIKNDIRNMWDDYNLINQMGFTIYEIRDLPPQKRDDLLRKIKNY